MKITVFICTEIILAIFFILKSLSSYFMNISKHATILSYLIRVWNIEIHIKFLKQFISKINKLSEKYYSLIIYV